jgi:Zn-dependent M28 family amino/carboxypeptidase
MPDLTGELQFRLRGHVQFLAGVVGERNSRRYRRLERAREYIEEVFTQSGYWIGHDLYECGGKEYRNVVAAVPGAVSVAPVLVVGAHYDTAWGSPGADDNASGVAVLIELARILVDEPAAASIRWVAFTLEESPHFKTDSMGSRVFARRCRQRGDSIRGMISLEMVGYYSGARRSQGHPLSLMRWFYPDRGNFIAVAGNYASRSLVRRLSRLLSAHGELPVEHIALPFVPGVDLSDNWSFWEEGYPALMVTDTAFFRNRHYHRSTDRPETLDYRSMELLVRGLAEALVRL